MVGKRDCSCRHIQRAVTAEAKMPRQTKMVRVKRRMMREPNELKLSDRHRRRKAKRSEKTGAPVPVRWSAWLGRPPTEGLWNAGKEGRGYRRGNDGRCRREWRSGGTGWPERKDGLTGRPERASGGCWLELGTGVPPATKGAGTGSPSKNPPGRIAGLTISSSATAHGDARRGLQKRRDRHEPFAGAPG